MLELTARHADAWNLAWFGMPDERLAGLRRELAEACETVGRDPVDTGDHRRDHRALPGRRRRLDRAADVARPDRHAGRDRRRAAGPCRGRR